MKVNYITVHCTGPIPGQDQRYHRRYPVHNHNAQVQFRYDATVASSHAWNIPFANVDTGRVTQVNRPPENSIQI